MCSHLISASFNIFATPPLPSNMVFFCMTDLLLGVSQRSSAPASEAAGVLFNQDFTAAGSVVSYVRLGFGGAAAAAATYKFKSCAKN